MRKFIVIAALLVIAPCLRAQTCNPGNTSGCPTSFSGSQGSTTPVAVTGSGYTVNGVTTASVDTFWGVPYNNTGCPYSSGGNDCTIQYFMPHEAPSNSNNYEIIIVFHGGGGSGGSAYSSDGFASGTGCCQRSITYVQQYLGTPNAVGGKGIIIAQINNRLTSGQAGSGTNIYPAAWQDAKCAIWHILANSSTFPGNKTKLGFYGPSWGGTMVGLAVLTPDNEYTTSCDSAAPGTDPQYIAVAAWPALSWFYGVGGTLGNGPFENVYNTSGNGTCAFASALIGQIYLSSDTALTQFCPGGASYYGSQTPAQVSTTMQGHVSAASPPYDPARNISSTSAAVLNNVSIKFQYGTPGNRTNCTTADCLVRPYWNVNGFDGGGGAAGGELYNMADAFSSTGVHPYMQILYPNIIHEGDTGQNPSPSQTDALNFLLQSARPLGGNVGGAGLGGS